MKLSDVITAAGARVSGGDPFMWKCYGENANFIEFRDTDSQGYAHAVYDTENYVVYEIHIEVPGQDQAFRWLNPDFKQAYYAEAVVMRVDPNMAWDEVGYIHVDTEELILEYLKDIGETYYDNLPIIESKDESFTMPMPGTLGGATITFKENDMNNTYMVNLDVRHTLEVKASSMDEAIKKATHFQETMPKGWGEHNDFEVCWIDTYIVKESAERETNI
jgi:hypothetical protein